MNDKRDAALHDLIRAPTRTSKYLIDCSYFSVIACISHIYDFSFRGYKGRQEIQIRFNATMHSERTFPQAVFLLDIVFSIYISRLLSFDNFLNNVRPYPTIVANSII